jgi:hypothetical protein
MMGFGLLTANPSMDTGGHLGSLVDAECGMNAEWLTAGLRRHARDLGHPRVPVKSGRPACSEPALRRGFRRSELLRDSNEVAISRRRITVCSGGERQSGALLIPARSLNGPLGMNARNSAPPHSGTRREGRACARVLGLRPYSAGEEMGRLCDGHTRRDGTPTRSTCLLRWPQRALRQGTAILPGMRRGMNRPAHPPQTPHRPDAERGEQLRRDLIPAARHVR